MIHHEPDGDVLIGENFVQPGSGPPMHTHWLQDEGFSVLEGRIGYQVAGQPAQYAQAGESIVFRRGYRIGSGTLARTYCTAKAG